MTELGWSLNAIALLVLNLIAAMNQVIFFALTQFILSSLIKMNLHLFAAKWQKLFQPFSGNSTLIQEVFFQLITAYSEKHRYYHNFSHIQKVLNFINQLEVLADNQPAIQMAAWFHDMIYDPKSQDNEEKSAEFAATSLMSFNVPLMTIDQVIQLILHTKKHDVPLNDIDSQILLDADLSILGSSEPEYLAYAQSIRQEYSWVSDAEYKLGRTKILQSFLDKKRIYSTDLAFELLDFPARNNINNELTALGKI